MPIEIQELVIRAVVNNANRQNSGNGDANESQPDSEHQHTVLEESVKRILEVLHESKNER